MLCRYSPLKKIAVCAVAAHLAWEAATLVRARRTATTALTPTPPLPEDGGQQHRSAVHLLVPALREQPFVQRTVKAFAKIRDDYPHAHIWFVTTAREQAPADGVATTKEILDKQLSSLNGDRMRVIEDPRSTGNKASQLNWAVDHIDRLTTASETQTWIGVFDFDSQPAAATAAWVAEVASRYDAEVIQSVPIGITSLGGPPNNIISRAVIFTEALHQAARSLGVERWKLDRAMAGRPKPQYLVGAGMFVRRDILRKVDGFPYVDDVPLGYRLSLSRARFATIPSMNRVDLPDTVDAHLGSQKFIARGIVSWPSVLSAARGDRSVRMIDHIRLATLGVADTVEITTYPWLAAVLTPTLLRGSWPGRVFAAAWWGFPIVQTLVMRRTLANELEADLWSVPALALAGASVGRRFWRTLGAWRLCADTARAQLLGDTVSFTKASRTTAATTAGDGR
jgi:hypothetical protein